MQRPGARAGGPRWEREIHMSRRSNRLHRTSRYFSTMLNHAGMQPRTQDARPEPKPMPLRPPLAGQRDAVGLAMIDEAGRCASSEEHQHAAKGAKQSHDRAGDGAKPDRRNARKRTKHGNMKGRRKSPKYRCQSCGRPFGDFVKLEEHPCKKADARAWRPTPTYGRQRIAESLSTRARTLHIQQFNGLGGTATTARNDMAATNARSQKVAEIGALRLPGGMIESELPAGGARLPLGEVSIDQMVSHLPHHGGVMPNQELVLGDERDSVAA